MRLEATPLSKLAAVRSGGGAPQDPSAFASTGFPFVRAGSLPKLIDGQDESSLEKLEPRVAEEHGLSLFPAGTVLFAKSGMSATKGHVYRLKTPAYVVNHLAALIPHVIEDSEFLVRVLQRFSPTTLIKDEAYPSIRLGDIERMKVMVPPDPAGRRRIAEILDKADALRAKRRAALALLDTLTQSTFLDMFGDPATNPKGWPIHRLGEVAEFFAGSTLPPGVDFTGQQDGYFLLKVSDMNLAGNEGFLTTCQQWSNSPGADACTCPPGSIVIPKRGGAIGTNKKRITARRSILDPNLMAVWPRPERLELSFLYLWFLRLDLGSLTSGSSVPQLNKRDLDPLRVAVPAIGLQREFSRRLAMVSHLVAPYGTSLAELNALFASLQHCAFRGEL